MLSSISSAVLYTLIATSAFSSATPLAARGGESPASQCNTGPVQCCKSVQSSSTPSCATLLGLVGAVVSGVNVPIGENCSPISVVGVGSGATCNAEPVCCENNSFNGVVAIGCSPVNINL